MPSSQGLQAAQGRQRQGGACLKGGSDRVELAGHIEVTEEGAEERTEQPLLCCNLGHLSEDRVGDLEYLIAALLPGVAIDPGEPGYGDLSGGEDAEVDQ
jgi:hypothetical protein